MLVIVADNILFNAIEVMVIVVVGKCAVGKSTFSEYLNHIYGFNVYEIGNYVRNAFIASNVKNKTLIEFVDDFAQRGELTHFVNNAIECSLKENHKNIIFSGIRTISELERIQKEYSSLLLVCIRCTNFNRKRRYTKFARDLVSLEHRSMIEEKWTNGSSLEDKADYIIDNNSSLETLYSSISEMMQKYEKEFFYE